MHGFDLLARQLLLRSLDLDLVPERVDGVLLDFEFNLGALGGLALTPLVTFNFDKTITRNVPRFFLQRIGEFAVVRDEKNATVVFLDGARERAEGVAIQIVGRFVHDDDVRLLPHGGTEHELNLLATGKTLDAVVGTEFGIQTKVDQVLLDVRLRERARVQARASGFALVNAVEVLGETILFELFALHPRVGVHGETLPLALVLVLGLLLAATKNLLDDELENGTILLRDRNLFLHHALFLFGVLRGDLGQVFLVFARGETPADVFVRRFVQVLLDVMERVLRDVRVTHVRVTPDGTLVRFGFTGEKLDEGRLTSTVRAEARDTRAQRELNGRVLDDLTRRVRVLEPALGRLDDGLVLVLHALEETRNREDELEFVVGELGVLLRRRALLDEFGEITSVRHQLAVLVVNDVSTHAIQETGIVRHNHGGNLRLRVEVLFQPRDVLHVQVVRRLIEQQDVRLHEDGARERELHLPATGEGDNRPVDHLVGELERGERGSDTFLGRTVALDDRVGENELNDVHRVLVTLDVVLDVHRAEFLRRREVFDLAVVDSLHQSGLAATVRAAQTVTLTLLHVKRGVVQQNERTVRQREVALAKIFAFFVLDDEDLLGGFVHGVSAFDERLGHGIGLGEEKLQVRGRARLGPGVEIEVLRQQRVGGQGANVVEVHLDAVALDKLRDVLLGRTGRFGQKLDELLADGFFVVDTLAFLAIFGTGFVARGLEQSLVRASTHLAALRVGDFVHGALQKRQKLGQERRGIHRIFDKFAHVVNDDGRLTLDRGGLLEEQTALEKRTHDGERRGFNLLNKSRRRELVHAFRNFIDVVDAFNQGRDERLDVQVTDARRNLGHGRGGRLLDFRAHVHHDLSELRNNFRQVRRDRLAVAIDETIEHAQRSHGGLPELRLETNKDRSQRRANRELAQLRRDGRHRRVASRAHIARLVIARERDRDLEQINQIRLLRERSPVRNLRNLFRRRLARVLVLLLRRLRLDPFDVSRRHLRRRGHVALARRHYLLFVCAGHDRARPRFTVSLPSPASRPRAREGLYG